MIFLLPGITAAVLVLLYKKKKLPVRAVIPLLLGTCMAAFLIFTENRNGGRTELHSVPVAAGDGSRSASLEMVTDEGEEQKITLVMDDGSYSGEEAQRQLNELCGKLDTEILGKNTSLDHVEWNLNFPVSFADSDITVQWMTEDTDLISWDGTLGTDIDPNGVTTEISARLYLGEEMLDYSRIITVYPSLEPEVLKAKVQEEADRLNTERKENAGSSSYDYLLPETAAGKKLTWYKETEKRGNYLCLILLLTGVLLVFLRKQKQEEKEEKHRQELLRKYPAVVSRLQLFLAAGLSLRKAIARLAPEFPELDRCRYELENGVPEADAYMRFGERCGIPEYRKLSLLLVQSQKKGGSQLSALLEREAQEAFENRKRQARIEGDKTAVRMILPMGLMLLVVLVIIMVPAMLSF